MNQEELKVMIARILQELEPSAKEEKTNRITLSRQEECLDDITQTDLRTLYLVEHPADGPGYSRLRQRTSARLGLGKAGPRYKTRTLLRFRADHAAAQDTVFAEIGPEFPEKNGLIPVQTRCASREEYLTRPDLGRGFDGENSAIIQKSLPKNPEVQIVIGDGLSCAAILANAMDCARAICQGLKGQGIDPGPILYVKNARVGAGDAVGDLTGCRVVCMLVGERPGLGSAESMSCYMTYNPHRGIPESARTVISNIHRGGTPAVEAGAHIAELLGTIVKAKASGVALMGGKNQ